MAQRTGCKVVPIAMYHTYKAKDIYFRAGNPMNLAEMEKRDALDALRNVMATMIYELMEEHAPVLKRAELSSDSRLAYIDERMREYICTKWSRDDWAMEITIYRDKTLPPTPEEVRESFDNVRLTTQNASILASILLRREEDKRYNLVKYMQENWKKGKTSIGAGRSFFV